VALILERRSTRVSEAFRPLVLMHDKEFDSLVDQTSRLNPVGETAAVGVAATFGLWVGYLGLTDDVFRLKQSLSLMSGLMLGLLAWTIYASTAGTRLTAELHRQPLRVDIFDISPFEPLGRQSLSVALVFVGGIFLSVILGLGQMDIFVWPNWFLYILLTLVPVVVFFLSMRDTHRVLAAEKKRQLEAVRGHIVRASRALTGLICSGEPTGTLAPEINAQAAYEEHLQITRTWPCDTAMLRTIFFGLIIPAGAELVKLASENFWSFRWLFASINVSRKALHFLAS
jgi:hypothetical protein